MDEDVEGFFLNKKPVRILVCLQNPMTGNYASALSRQVEATYSHTIKVLQQMKELELVEFEKDGRRKNVELTDIGESLAEDFADSLETIRKVERQE